jgi:VIT1/CCC1 family predicted Fe2+/Mn2+ transporter
LKGSAWEAAIASFLMFAVGAILPVFPYMIWDGNSALYISIGASVLGLFFIGSLLHFLLEKASYIQVLGWFFLDFCIFNHLGIGKWIGVSVAG